MIKPLQDSSYTNGELERLDLVFYSEEAPYQKDKGPLRWDSLL